LRGSAERNAINAPIQGTAADMIKLAMISIQQTLHERKLKTRMLLQVHDELVFELEPSEEGEVRALVSEKMANAIPLQVPIVVDIGVGTNWLEHISLGRSAVAPESGFFFLVCHDISSISSWCGLLLWPTWVNFPENAGYSLHL